MRALGILLGIAIALGLAYLLVQRAGTTSSQPDLPSTGGESPALPRSNDGRALPPPLSEEERERDRYQEARTPLFARLRARYTDSTARIRVGDRLDTLEILIDTRPTSPELNRMIEEALAEQPGGYGFRHIHVALSATPGSGAPDELLAEVTMSEDGRWITFLR